jgi:lysophospholipase L1-like esterase
VRFLALGDSYTIGEGVAEEMRWPNQLARTLRSQRIAVDEPQLVARTAWTTDELSDAIAAANLSGPFDLVTLMVGVNDQYRSREVQSFAGEYAKLLARAIAFAYDDPARVLAVSIPDWGATPFAEGRDATLIAQQIDAYNSKGEELARAVGVQWVNVTDISRAMRDDPSLVVSDKLHPSGEMYRRWAELIVPRAAAILSR